MDKPVFSKKYQTIEPNNDNYQLYDRNKPQEYLETNGKENPEWIINQQVEDLVYDIKSGIDELYAQQANIDRSLNNKKLSSFEKKYWMSWM